MNFKIFILALLVATSAWAQPQMVDLETTPVPTASGSRIFEEFFNVSPNFSIYQEHQGLKDLFDLEGYSQLCFPASLAHSFLSQFKKDPQSFSSIPLKGLSVDKKKIDANELVRELAKCSKFDHVRGVMITDGANCIVKTYQEAGLTFEIKVIRLKSKLSEFFDPTIEQLHRTPEPADIKEALDKGFQVIGLVDWLNPFGVDEWSYKGGHFFNIFGYSRQFGWPEDLYLLHVTNPYRIYSPRKGFPHYDSVLINRIRKDDDTEWFFSPYFMEGMGFQGLSSKANLDSLLLFKILN